MNQRLLLLCIFLIASSQVSADDWPQWRGPNRDGVWSESGVISEFDSPEIQLKWRVPISSGYSGPTVANGFVYVSDRVVQPKEIERIHCFRWETGNRVWSYEYDCPYGEVGYQAGPRAAVLVYDGLAYSLGATGTLICFDALSGKIVWEHDLKSQYKIRMPNWGIAASPVIENDLLIVQIGGADACIVAFDRKSGAERWTSQSDDASYSAPIVIDQAGKRVLVCWTGERVLGLNPADGELHWEQDYRFEK